MAATLNAKAPKRQTAAPPDDLAHARAVARECYAMLKYRMSFDRKTMARLAELAAANRWLEEERG